MLSVSLLLHTQKVFVFVDVIAVVGTAYSQVLVFVDVIAVVGTAYSKVFVFVDVIAVVVTAYSKRLCFYLCYRCRCYCIL